MNNFKFYDEVYQIKDRKSLNFKIIDPYKSLFFNSIIDHNFITFKIPFWCKSHLDPDRKLVENFKKSSIQFYFF